MYYPFRRFNILVNQKSRTNYALPSIKQISQNFYCTLNEDYFCICIDTLRCWARQGWGWLSCISPSCDHFHTKQWKWWKEGSSAPSLMNSSLIDCCFILQCMDVLKNSLNLEILLVLFRSTHEWWVQLLHLFSEKKKVVLTVLKIVKVFYEAKPCNLQSLGSCLDCCSHKAINSMAMSSI